MKIKVLTPIYKCRLCGQYITKKLTPTAYVDDTGDIINPAPDTIIHYCGIDVLMADISGIDPRDKIYGVCDLVGYK